ncbi:MAG: PQQ-binding-like beta-propeller repeat protein [Planctomycetaceae bacterium]
MLITRWSQPTTERPSIAQEITQLVDDLHDAGRACVPAAIPLVVDGKVVYRTMRGLSVVDAETGQKVWETPEGVSIERLLAGDDVLRPGTEIDRHRNRPLPLNQGNEADYHSLTVPLFRDGVYGLISSDGERVFVLEDHATLSYQQPGYPQSRQRQDDPCGRDWESNRLVAYDLQTGRIDWTVGGTQLNDRFDPPMAGVLFQGPPVVDGDELFVIGEYRGSETLFVLDRKTGEKLWSHSLATVSTEIDADLVRRWWPTLPAVGPGVIVCPTTVGWMLAIDRYEHRIRWAHRVTPRHENQQQSRQATVAINGPVNHRWAPSAPILSAGHVIFTPPELPDPVNQSEAQLVCLDALTGKQRWHRAKEQSLYVAGVADGMVLLVSSDRMEARRLHDGHRIWQTQIDADDGPPSGHGVITGDDYLLPLHSGQLWRLSLTDGSISQKSTFSVPHEPLGNLLVDPGRLLSLSPLAMTSFASRRSVEASLAQSTEEPLTSTAALQAAELSIIDGANHTALELLNHLSEADLAASQEVHTRRRLLRTALVALTRKDLPNSDQYISILRQLVDSPQQQLNVEQLEAERLIALDRLPEAFEVYWRRAHSSSDMMVISEEGTLRIDRWLSHHLSDIWSALTPEQRTDLNSKISSLIDTLPENANAEQEWWASVLRFHSVRVPLEEQLATRALTENRLAEAEIRLLRLLSERIPSDRHRQALATLLQLFKDQDRAEDAAAMIATWTDTTLAQVDNSNQLTDSSPSGGLPSDWTSDEFELSRVSSSQNKRVMPLSVHRADGVPSLDHLQFRVQQQLQRLNVDQLNGERFWEMPLQFQPQSQFNQLVVAGSIGQTMYLVHRGVLHALNLTDREQLWHRHFDTRSTTDGYTRQAFTNQQQEMTTASVFRMTHGIRQRAVPTGMLAVWNPGYVCYYGRNNITAVDSLTGETLWTRTGIGPHTKVTGNCRHLFVIPPSPAEPFALDASDGALVSLPELNDLIKSAIAVDEQGLVTLSVERSGFLGLGRRDSTLQLVDEQTAMPLWTATFPENTQFTQLRDDELLALEPGGNLRLVNWSDQTDMTIGQLDAAAIDDSESLFAISDRQQVYLSLVHGSENRYWSDRVDSIPANGTLAVYDRSGKGLVWQADLTDTNLLVEHFAHLPVLVLHARRLSPGIPNAPAQQVQFQMLDKWTGKPMLDETRYVSASTFREIDFDLTKRTIDLKTYREQLRIQPKANGGRQPVDDAPSDSSSDNETEPER